MATTTPNDSPGQAVSAGLLKMWAALAAVLLVALGGATLAYLHASATANCVNAILASRNGPSTRDAEAHIAWAKAVKAAVNTPPSASRAQQEAAGAALRAATSRYFVVLVADQKVRAQHPLGAC